MRLLLVLFIIFLVVAIILGTALFFVIRSFDINDYKDEIAKGLSQNLNQPVKLGRIDFNISWAQGITLKISKLRIGEEPPGDSNLFIRAQTLLLGLDIKAFLMEQEILVTNIEINDPYIYFVKKTNTGVLTPSKSPRNSSGQAMQKGSFPDTEIEIKGKKYAFRIKDIKINQGELDYIDQDQAPQLSIPVKDIFVSMDEVTGDKPFKTNLSCNLWSDRANIRYSGEAQADVAKKAVTLRQGELVTDLKTFSLNDLQNSVPQIGSWGLDSPLEGDITIDLNKAVVDSSGIAELSVAGTLNNGMLKQTYLKCPIRDIYADLSMDETDIIIKKVGAKLADGDLNGKVRINDYLGELLYTVDMNMHNIEINDVLPDFHPDIQLKGKMNGDIHATSKGRTPEDMKANVDGRADVRVEEGALMHINILRLVLSKISLIPNLVDRIYENLTPKYRQLLNEQNTYFGSVHAGVDLTNKGIVFKEVTIESETFVLSSHGQLSWDQYLSLGGEVRIPAELSQSMTAAVGELEYLADINGILIPLKSYQGPLASLKVMPDLEYISKRVLVSKGKEELNKLLDKVFDKDEGAENFSDQDEMDDQQDESTSSQSPERQIIEGVLDAIFQ